MRVCATPPFGSPFCRKWMEWSVSKIYVAGDAANNHKKRSNGGGDFRQPGSALRFGVGIATPTPPSILANVFFVFFMWQLTGTKSEASINNSSLLFKRSRGACNRVSVPDSDSPCPSPPSLSPLPPLRSVSGGLLHSYLLKLPQGFATKL